MEKMILKLKHCLEIQFFGVCQYIGEKLSMPSKSIRLFFIYLTFVTAGSTVIVYLVMSFLLKLRDYIKGKRNPIWDF
jgi:phage shock protein C